MPAAKLRKTLEGKVLNARQIIMHLTEETAGDLTKRLTLGDAAVTALIVVGGMVGACGIAAGTYRLFRHKNTPYFR